MGLEEEIIELEPDEYEQLKHFDETRQVASKANKDLRMAKGDKDAIFEKHALVAGKAYRFNEFRLTVTEVESREVAAHTRDAQSRYNVKNLMGTDDDNLP